MKRKNRYIFIVLILSTVFCFSCADEFETPAPPVSGPGNDGQGIFLSTPPDFDITLEHSQLNNALQKNITEQGVSVKITERPWIGTDMEDKPGQQLKATWNDIVWEKDYANIGVFTVKSTDIASYEGGGDRQYIRCYPFVGEKGGDGDLKYTYQQPSGNDSPNNPYDYYNANRLVDARNTIKSDTFFKHSADDVELNFYGYFPYQHQTAGILYTKPATSICKVLQANLHEDNLLEMPYTFAATQTKDNIRRHDVMYSVSEDAGLRNRYGNKNKKRHGSDYNKNDNVHMRFVHSFCRLQFNISAGSYRSGKSEPIALSRLSVVGPKVFVDGNLNLIDGIVSPGNASTIIRALDNGQESKIPGDDEIFVDLRKENLAISMIVQPTGEITSLEDFKIICVIDGVEYTCPLSVGVELKKNHVYDVNLELSPETKVLVFSGGGAVVATYDCDRDEYENTPTSVKAMDVLNKTGEINGTFAKFIIAKPNAGWRIFKIIENGKVLDNISSFLIPSSSPAEYLIPIERAENETKKYEIICIPKDWYARPEALITHLDGKLNDGFADENAPDFMQQIVPIWKDLTYNGNDGILYNYDLTGYSPNVNDTEPLATGNLIAQDRSGWDGKGLKCDGKDDVTAFPGKINKEEYTLSVYLCIARAQQGEFHRIISSGNDTRYGFPGMVLNTRATRLRLFGHDADEAFGGGDQLYTGRTPGVDIIQIDYVYKKSEKKLWLYVNGEEQHGRTSVKERMDPVLWTALGGRLTDISRQINATYYNVMVYNEALDASDIKKNYVLNARRYGVTKTGGSVILSP